MDVPAGPSQEDRFWIAGIVRAVGHRGKVAITAAQNRHADEIEPSWVLRVETDIEGASLSVENDGPELDMLLADARRVLTGLGFVVEMFEGMEAVAERVVREHPELMRDTLSNDDGSPGPAGP